MKADKINGLQIRRKVQLYTHATFVPDVIAEC